jgi:hypothetical protein
MNKLRLDVIEVAEKDPHVRNWGLIVYQEFFKVLTFIHV